MLTAALLFVAVQTSVTGHNEKGRALLCPLCGPATTHQPFVLLFSLTPTHSESDHHHLWRHVVAEQQQINNPLLE